MSNSQCVFAFTIVFVLMGAGCATLTLQPADFSWPIEILAKPDSSGYIQEARYKLTFNIKPLLFEEFKDSVKVASRVLHIIRDRNGYYFIVAKDFRNVYIFSQGKGALELKKKIFISKNGLEAPAFNQKESFLQLVNEEKENETPILLSIDGILRGGTK